MLIRWNPWTESSALDPLFQAWLGDRNQKVSALHANGDAKAPALLTPPVDIHEDATRILLVADLPGLEQSDVAITVDKNVLTIRGERKATLGEEAGNCRRERLHGLFSRAFTLPPTVDVDGVAAEMKAGVLTVTLPKRPEAQPRQIKINQVQ